MRAHATTANFDFNPPVITEPSVLVASTGTGVVERNPSPVMLWPNPTLDHIRIRAEEVITAVRTFSMDGREVMRSSHRSEEVMVGLEHLSAGCYIVEVQLGSGNTQRATVAKH